MLTAVEADALRHAFADVTIHPSPDPLCQCVIIDPCAVGSSAWDEVRISHFHCFETFVAPASVTAILDLLESFRAGQ